MTTQPLSKRFVIRPNEPDCGMVSEPRIVRLGGLQRLNRLVIRCLTVALSRQD